MRADRPVTADRKIGGSNGRRKAHHPHQRSWPSTKPHDFSSCVADGMAKTLPLSPLFAALVTVVAQRTSRG